MGEYANVRLLKETVYLLKLIAAKLDTTIIEVVREFAEQKARELGVNDDKDREGNRNRRSNK